MIEQGLCEFDNIKLMQIRVDALFPVFLAIALPAAFDRISWLPTSLPAVR